MSASNHLASYDQYENLKQILRPEHAALPPAEIGALMEGMFGPGANYTTFNTIKGTAVGKSIAVPIFNYRNVGHKQHARPTRLAGNGASWRSRGEICPSPIVRPRSRCVSGADRISEERPLGFACTFRESCPG